MMKHLQSRLKFLSAACKRAATQGIQESVSAAQREAKSSAPVDTGRLRRSIQCESKEFSGTVYSTCDYAQWVELGGRDTPAHPFLYPAAQMQATAFPRRVIQIFRRTMKGGK